jgi:hypothetical protein
MYTQKPYNVFLAITPSDTDDLPAGRTAAIFVGTAGTVAVQDQAGNTVSFTAPVGVLPIAVKRVLATGTTATNLVALYVV